MAGTDDDNSTFRWLCDEYAFLLRPTRSSKDFANKLVQRFLEEGERDRDGRIRYKIWMFEAFPGGLAPSPYDGAFWRSDPGRGINCTIEPWNSSARWTGPGSAEWEKFDGRQSADYSVSGIRLNHEIFLEFLQSVGFRLEQLLEVAPETTAPPSSPSPPLEDPQAETSEQKDDGDPQPAKKIRLKDWLPGAVERWPRDETDTNDYPEFLRQRRPKKWTKHYIQSELSKLAREKRAKKD
jgi:hypothetical protein